MNTRANGVRAGMALAAALVLGAGVFVPGCAMDRASALRSRAQGIEADLLVAQKRASDLPPQEREAKLEQLDNLREALAAANIARDNLKNLTSGVTQDVAYSLTEEAYGLIEWRMGMPPGSGDETVVNVVDKLNVKEIIE